MSWYDYTPQGAIYNLGKKGYKWAEENIGPAFDRGADQPAVDADGNIAGQSELAGNFANASQNAFWQRGQDMKGVADQLGRLSRGQDSYSAAQLQQALASNMSAQRSMAAGARPGNTAMAARQAAIQQGKLGSGLAGQQALAGIAERQAASQQLGQLLGQMRGQELQGALGGRGQALQGYGTIEGARSSRYGAAMGAPTFGEQALGAGMGLAGMAAMSDRRAKTDVKPADDDATKLLEGLSAYRYRYRDNKHGKGAQLGIMAQDLEKAGAKHAVIDTPQGKMVDGAKLAGALAAASAALHKRVKTLEGK